MVPTIVIAESIRRSWTPTHIREFNSPELRPFTSYRRSLIDMLEAECNAPLTESEVQAALAMI